MHTPLQKHIQTTQGVINTLGDDLIDTVAKTALRVSIASAKEIEDPDLQHEINCLNDEVAQLRERIRNANQNFKSFINNQVNPVLSSNVVPFDDEEELDKLFQNPLHNDY